MKSNKINLRQVFMELQSQMISRLSTDGAAIRHPTTKGDASELNWIDMLSRYLPERYQVNKAFILDYEGTLSEQIDVVIYDRQYSPFLFNQDGAIYVPSESVYAVFEVKPNLSKEVIKYAGHKAMSVRKLKRTSIKIPHAGGQYQPKKPFDIIAGILTLKSDWKPALGSSLLSVCETLSNLEKIDLGCCLRCGGFNLRYGTTVKIQKSEKDDALIFFFLRLLERLQRLGTVAAMDISQYAKALQNNRG
jgi:hypothetical protein